MASTLTARILALPFDTSELTFEQSLAAVLAIIDRAIAAESHDG